MDPLFDRFPQLRNLLGKVPVSMIREELGPKVALYDEVVARIGSLIPTVRLCDVFPAELEAGKITLERFLGQWGNISIEELCKICLIVAWLKPKSVFEFGTYNGMTTLQMALNTPDDCHITTLDVPPSQAVSLEIGGIDGVLAQKAGAFDLAIGHYFKESKVVDKILQVWGDSTRFNFEPFAQQMDFVFVDAGHTYAYVKADTQNALKMIRPGGVIVWHDYHQVLHPDVMVCLGEFAADGMRIVHLRGTNLAVYHHVAG